MMLIVVSHVNQMIIANHLVRAYAPNGDARVAVLAPPSKINTLQRQAATTIFEVPYTSVLFVHQPEAPLKHSLSNARRLEKIYKDLLDRTRPDQLVVFAYGRHYGILLDIAKKAGVETWCAEEGCSTYVPERHLVEGNRFSWVRLFYQWFLAVREEWRDTWLWEAMGYPWRFLKTLRGFWRAPEIQLLLLKGSRFRDVLTYDGWRFDRAVVAFPDRLSPHVVADRVDRIDVARFRILAAPPVSTPARKILFLSQLSPWGRWAEAYYRWMLFLLADLACANDAAIVIKPHPREGLEPLEAALAKSGSPRLSLLDRETREISAEALLTGRAGRDYAALASINSSALLYIREIRPDLPVVNISRALVECLRSEGVWEMPLQRFRTLDQAAFAGLMPAPQYDPDVPDRVFISHAMSGLADKCISASS